MTYLGIEEQIQEVRTRDPRYGTAGYFFILEALDYTIANLGRYEKSGLDRHVGGLELLDGIREFAIHKFGPLAESVFAHWGIYETIDLGEVVFNMVECGLLNSRPEDSKVDFLAGFEFSQAFSAATATQIDWDNICWDQDQN